MIHALQRYLFLLKTAAALFLFPGISSIANNKKIPESFCLQGFYFSEN